MGASSRVSEREAQPFHSEFTSEPQQGLEAVTTLLRSIQQSLRHVRGILPADQATLNNQAQQVLRNIPRIPEENQDPLAHRRLVGPKLTLDTVPDNLGQILEDAQAVGEAAQKVRIARPLALRLLQIVSDGKEELNSSGVSIPQGRPATPSKQQAPSPSSSTTESIAKLAPSPLGDTVEDKALERAIRQRDLAPRQQLLLMTYIDLLKRGDESYVPRDTLFDQVACLLDADGESAKFKKNFSAALNALAHMMLQGEKLSIPDPAARTGKRTIKVYKPKLEQLTLALIQWRRRS